MSLKQGPSKKTISANVKTEMKYGKPKKQAIVLDLFKAKKSKHAK